MIMYQLKKECKIRNKNNGEKIYFYKDELLPVRVFDMSPVPRENVRLVNVVYDNIKYVCGLYFPKNNDELLIIAEDVTLQETKTGTIN